MQSTGRIDARIIGSLSEEAALYLSDASSIDRVLRAYYADTRVKRLISHACRQFRQSENFVDELLQDLAILLVEKFILSLNEPEKIYNVLHVSALHIAQRKSLKISESSLDALLEGFDRRDLSTSLVMIDETTSQALIDDRIDRESAIAEFQRRSVKAGEKGQDMLQTIPERANNLCSIDRAQHIVQDHTATKKRKNDPEAQEELSDEAIELNTIRRDLGYTVPDFAALLNIPKGTISSYLYGTVRNIPTGLLREARQLRDQAGTKFSDMVAMYSAMTMEELLKKWVTKLGPFEDQKAADSRLSEVLKVDRATIWRWRERNMRPDPRKMHEYDVLVLQATLTPTLKLKARRA